jgi:hypothetical protein
MAALGPHHYQPETQAVQAAALQVTVAAVVAVQAVVVLMPLLLQTVQELNRI